MPEEIENYGGVFGRLGLGARPQPLEGATCSVPCLQCTVAELGAQETQASPPPSSTRPVVSLPPKPSLDPPPVTTQVLAAGPRLGQKTPHYPHR